MLYRPPTEEAVKTIGRRRTVKSDKLQKSFISIMAIDDMLAESANNKEFPKCHVIKKMIAGDIIKLLDINHLHNYQVILTT